MKNGILHGRVYNWTALLAERMYEFMTLQHQTFYMPHYAIGLFMEATANQLPLDDFDTPLRENLAEREPPIFYW